MLDKIIVYSFYLLFFLIPLIWTPVNYELFEYNKMLFVYFLTLVITGAWILKMINLRLIILNSTPLDIPILLFLGANILSTIFSIDPHTSVWGYYSRPNGGLLSIISYSLLYFALTSNLDKEKAVKLLKIGLWGGLIVALWAIPEHFGVSPSCAILQGELNADCWVQDVKARVFATLGQPNWLAAYLAMLIFPALYFFLTAKTRVQLVTCYLLLVTFYLAFTFTYSRGAILGLIGGMTVFILVLILRHPERSEGSFVVGRFLISILLSFLVINLFFGSALTRFQLSQLLPKSPQVPAYPQAGGSLQVGKISSSTQLETGGTESGQIRFIVWKGALDIFKAYPLFGSGVETFAYSYYQFRPKEHNLVSEWDFLYNKAHNEYLNYLANIGIVGLGTYIIMIITVIISILKKLGSNHLLLTAILASYISYLVQNIVGFSVVIIALFFYLFPAIAFIVTDSIKPISKLLTTHYSLLTLLYYRPIYTKFAKGLVIVFTLYLLFSIFRLWQADTFYALGENASRSGNAGASYNYLIEAVFLNRSEPLYRSELAYAAAAASLALKETEASLSAELKDRAITGMEDVLAKNPSNTSFWRTAIETYYYALSSGDEKYFPKTIEAIDKTISLAPTDPKLYYKKAVILGTLDQTDEAIAALKKAIELKPNYREAYYALALFYFDLKKVNLALENMNTALKLLPNDPEAIGKLVEWGKQGIATQEAAK